VGRAGHRGGSHLFHSVRHGGLCGNDRLLCLAVNVSQHVLACCSPYYTVNFSAVAFVRGYASSGVDLPQNMRSGQGQSGQAIKLFQTHRKNSFYLPLLIQVFHPWLYETCRVIRQQIRMKECDIFMGSKHTLIPLTYFQGSRPPTPGIYTPVRSHAGSQLTSKKPAKSVGLSVRQSRPNERAATPRPTIYISNKGQWRMVISTIKFSKIKNHNRNRKITHSRWKEREGVIYVRRYDPQLMARRTGMAYFRLRADCRSGARQRTLI